MQLKTATLLWDMREAASSIIAFTAGKTFDDYVEDKMMRLAVERSFEIIGEAMTRLVRPDEATARLITDYQKIRGFRNHLAHGYDAVDHSISWRVVTTKISILLAELRQLLPDEP